LGEGKKPPKNFFNYRIGSKGERRGEGKKKSEKRKREKIRRFKESVGCWICGKSAKTMGKERLCKEGKIKEKICDGPRRERTVREAGKEDLRCSASARAATTAAAASSAAAAASTCSG
jgi:hypothetical protein